MKEPKNIILLTATITPMASGGSRTLRADPDLRRYDYEKALRFYLSLPKGTINGVLFCENSGSNLESLKKIALEENPNDVFVEFFSTTSSCPVEYGKGHSELFMMDEAYANHISNAQDSVRYWKVTGRLIILNIINIIEKSPKEFDVYIDLRLVPSALRIFGTNRWADTRIFSFTKKGYKNNFLGRRELVGTPERQHLHNNHVVELMFFDHLYLASKVDRKIFPRLRTQPIMVGIGAESLKDYNDFPSKTKNIMRRISRKFFPWLWI